MNRDSGYICNAVLADWHWKKNPSQVSEEHFVSCSCCPHGSRDPHFITMVQVDKELWKKLPQRKRGKWDASIRGKWERQHLKTHCWTTPIQGQTISLYHTSKFKSCNHAVTKILLSGTGSVAIRKNRSKGGSRNESKGPNPDVQICNNSIITTENHFTLKCGCKANLLNEISKTNQHHHKTGCIWYRSIEYYTNLSNYSFTALLMGIYMMDINFHERPDWAKNSVPLGQASIQWHVLSLSPVFQRLTLLQGGHQEAFPQWKGCQILK